MADYGCFPLWDLDGIGNINPDELSLSPSLRAALEAWMIVYDATLNWADPRASGFSSPLGKIWFDGRGVWLWYRLRRELGRNYRVLYFSECTQCLWG